MTAAEDPLYLPYRIEGSDPAGLPPGPKGLPVVGSFFELRRDPFEVISRGAASYGDMFRIRMPFLDLVAVTHPDLLREFMDDAEG